MPKVLVPLAQGCEELEAVTIIDLLRRAEVDVVTAGLTDEPVTASRGTVLIADTTLDAVLDQDFDMIVLPGGLPGATYLQEDSRVCDLLRRQQTQDRYVAAICAAPRALAATGLLEGKTATAYPGALVADDMPGTHLTDAPVEVDGKIVTGRGPGTAMDFALQLVEILRGRATRDAVERDLVRNT